jgi:hypothetical protein
MRRRRAATPQDVYPVCSEGRDGTNVHCFGDVFLQAYTQYDKDHESALREGLEGEARGAGLTATPCETLALLRERLDYVALS